ncbi:uncharacterized protein LOC123541782 [Mercenaria mercenaria]|uniref:uncharacterized protein LOC123541782 n=1 Tax=Mercenaria mercenaria TaxID=6596 RepID=UPI00234F3EEF|nr:uncharacterized protein LOC123541782 [Mercenaria mercenaria]
MTCDNDTNEWVTEGECQEYTYPLNITDIRLSDGNRSSRGRVEIQSVGFWGTICDDSFGMAEANVICSMVGYPRAVSVRGNANYGKGKGPIFADDLECEQSATHINNCTYATYDNCQHSDDVSVICTDCGDPKPAHGFINSSDTSLDAVVQVQCEQGYRLNGRSVIQCMETNNWSDDPTCKLIDCGDPSPANGARNSTETANGTVVQISCDKGYNLSGDALITCQPDDTWTDYPTCEIIDCGWPDPSNAAVDISDNVTTFEAIAVVSCLTGYRPGGKLSVSCMANGSWEAWPQCEIIDCGDPTPNKGHRNDTNSTYASVVEITCDKGLEISGNSTIICMADGTWSDNPVCDSSDCGKLSVSHGTVNMSSGTTTGALVSVSCNKGYDLVGPDIVACSVLGWNETVSCVLQDCGDPTPENGKLISTEGTKFGNKVDIECNVGHELIGDRTITCQDGGVWSHNTSCRIRDCGEPVNYPSNGKWNDEEGTKYNATIKFDCKDGYLLVGEKMIFCQSNGTWSGSPPTCTLKASIGGYCLNTEYCKTIKAVCEQSVCTCKTGIHDEKTDTCDTMPLFPYGKDNGDIVLSKDEVCGPNIVFAPGIPLIDKMHKELHVCSNGLISFDSRYNNPTPPNDRTSISDFGNRSLLAPFYAQIDKKSGSVYYRTYDIHKSFAKLKADKRLIHQIEDTIKKVGAVKTFETSFALLATWDGLKPSGIDYDETKTSTFQAVLASDGSSTFTFFIYGQGLMQWRYKGASPLRIWVGYTINSLNFYTHPLSFFEQILSLDGSKQSIPGSYNGVAGLIFKPLTRDGEQSPNHAVDCIKWYNNNLKEKEHTRIIASRLPHCPCDIWLSRYDPWFWNIDRWSKDPYTCVDMFPGQIYRPYGKSCCYDLSTWSWISHRPVAGGFYRYHPQKFSAEHFKHDVIPKQKCCELSKFCDLYYELHPIGACYKKSTYDFGTFWGDPHFRTLDGMNFTFNGLGEYILLKLHTDNVTFELQARTERARKSDGEMSDATVFCAFAAKESSNASVHVELNKAKNGISVYGNNQDLTSKFSNYTDTMHPFTYTSDEGNLKISRRDGALDVYFPLSDISLNISVSVEMLSLITTIAKKWHNMTTGLLGNYDGNPKNDFSLPNGTILSADMTEREVFAYGKTWRINPNNSAFIYNEGKTHFDYHNETYIPRFLDEVNPAKVLEAENTCNGSQNIECIFDFVFTEKPEIAENSNRIKGQSETIKNEMDETVPTVTGCDTVNITIGQNVTCEVTLEEGNDIHFVENNVSAEYNREMSAVTYFQQDDSPVNLRFTARNVNGRSSPPFIISILLCTGCNGRGTCTDSPREDPRETEYFKYATCICDSEYEGLDCEHEFDACSANPCSFGRNCTKISAEEQRSSLGRTYKCGACPPGFSSKADGYHFECFDVNECSTEICEHNCTNTEGSYMCTCREGYRVDTRNSSLCRDINECDEALHNCSQECNNTEGGYDCTCHSSFYFNSSTWSCLTLEGSKCTSDEEKKCLNKTSDCTKLNGNSTCICKAGFKWNKTASTCDDINECERSVCPQNCINTFGSFRCECFVGYQLQDATTCTQCDVQHWGENCSHKCDCTGQGATRCDPAKGCICANGWEGETCNDDINECEVVGDICKDPRKLCVNSLGAYRCNCRSGYLETNKGLCEDVNECSYPLMNDCMQECSNTVGGYTCGCFDGFTRGNVTQCMDIDECELGTSGCEQVCKNSPGLFSCYCHFGYTLNDDRKSCTKVSDPCKSISNLNCSHYCLDDNATCRCQKGYTLGTDGQTCLDNNECEKDPCDTGAECMNTEGHYVCKCPVGTKLENDGRTCTGCDKFHYGEECSQTCSCLHGVCDSVTGCTCKDGWTGINCDKNECETGSIKCIEENTMCVNTPGSAACVCIAGYANISGICKDIDECQHTTLNLCDQTCSNTEGSYSCGCHRGFVYSKGKCTDINECSRTDECDHVCENTIGSYRCLCEPGFRLDLTDRKSCIVNSECSQTAIENCGKNASCYIRNGVSGCICNKGFHNANERCDDIDECISEKHGCSHSCNNTVGGYKCHCPVGFSLQTDMVTCTECNEGTYGSNCTSKCTCVPANTYTCDRKTGHCSCMQGWKGKICDQDIDECKQTPNCPVNSHCVNNNGSYVCKCEKGYIKSSKGNCEECGKRHYGDNCVEECRCDFQNTDSCNHITGNCTCKKGWKGNTCTEDIDECKADTDPCGEVANSICNNTVGSYACVCQRGYTKQDNGCKDVDECLLGRDVCEQQCVNTIGSYRCKCQKGFKGSWNNCSQCTDNTFGENCTETCNCNLANSVKVSQTCDTVSGKCQCKANWKGNTCDTDVDECSDGIHICKAEEHKGCHNTPGWYLCECLRGYSDSNGTCVKVETETKPSAKPASSIVVDLNVTIDVKLPTGTNIEVGKTYNEIETDVKASLLELYSRFTKAKISIAINDIRIGSLIVVYTVIYEENDLNVASALTKATIELSRETSITFQGKKYKVSTDAYKGIEPCSVYLMSVGNCDDGYKCVVEKDVPICRLENSQFNLPIIIGASAGGFVLIVAMIIVIVCLRKRRQGQKLDQRLRRLTTASDLAKSKEGMEPPKAESNYYHIMKWQKNLQEQDESKYMTWKSMASRFTVASAAETVYDQPYQIPRARIQQSTIRENDYLTLS